MSGEHETPLPPQDAHGNEPDEPDPSSARVTLVADQVGSVPSMTAARLGAVVRFGERQRRVARFEVQLVRRSPPGADAWDSPLWEDSGTDAGPAPVGGTGPRGPGGMESPTFLTLDGRPAVSGMRVDSRLPIAWLSVPEPIDMFEWGLREDRARHDGAKEVTDGISADGLCLSITPTKRLRRTGQDRNVNLVPGVFKPPMEPQRDPRRKGRYFGSTYPTHTPKAVDFNRTGVGDKGDEVYAAADGDVVFHDPDNGEIHIDHPGGFTTVYGHMDPIFATSGPVTVLTRIGLISDVGPNVTGPHLHHSQKEGGISVPVAFDGRPYVLGRPEAGFRRPTGRSEALLRVRVRRSSDGAWSRRVALLFEVSRDGDGPGGAAGLGCTDVGKAFAIRPRYTGDALDAGRYSIRYRVIDDTGEASPWAFDHSIKVGNRD